jgi:hypothetical protein
MMGAVSLVGRSVPLLKPGDKGFKTLLDTVPSAHYLAILFTFTRFSSFMTLLPR